MIRAQKRCVYHPDRPAEWVAVADGVGMCSACTVTTIRDEHERITKALAEIVVDDPDEPLLNANTLAFTARPQRRGGGK